MFFHRLIIAFCVCISVGAAWAVNAPAQRQPLPASTPAAASATATPPAVSVTPPPGAGFSPDSPANFDPAKFGTLTTSSLPLENEKRLVARVNGRPITWDDFVVALELMGATLLTQHPNARDGIIAAIAAPIMDSLILQELHREYADKNKLVIQPAEAKRKLGELIENAIGPAKLALQRLNQDQLSRLATDTLIREKVEKFLGDQATSVSPSLEEISEITGAVGELLTTAPEITLRARHIVIRATPDMSEFNINDARATAEDVLGRIRGGLDFATAARQYSQDRFTAYLNGNVGYFTRGSMFEAFEDAAFKLQPGEISGIVRTPVGFHIIQVTERHPDNLRLLIDSYRKSRAVEAWKQQALESARVEKYLGGG